MVCADILKIHSQSQSLSSQISSNLADLKNINNKVVNNESCSPTYSGILKSTYKNKPSTNSTNYLILGDFNYHFGSIETYHTEFANLIYTLSLSQQLTFSSPTHIKNNILDLVITPSYPSFTLIHPKISNLITDHYSIQFTLDIEMALPKQVLRYYRKLSAIDYELFQSDFLDTLSREPLTAEFLNNSIISIINIHAPICNLTIIPRLKSPWFNSILSSIKRSYRNAEKKYMQTSL